MIIYKVTGWNRGSYYENDENYFDTIEKAENYCRSKGFYRKGGYSGNVRESPFTEKWLLKVGNFLLDVSHIESLEEYEDGDFFFLHCDFMSIDEITVY